MPQTSIADEVLEDFGLLTQQLLGQLISLALQASPWLLGGIGAWAALCAMIHALRGSLSSASAALATGILRSLLPAAFYYVIPQVLDIERILHDPASRKADLLQVIAVWVIVPLLAHGLARMGDQYGGKSDKVQFSLPKITFEWEQGKNYYRQAMNERDETLLGPERGGDFLKMPQLWDSDYPPRAAFDEAMLEAFLLDSEQPPHYLGTALQYKAAAKKALDAWRTAVKAASVTCAAAARPAPTRVEGIAAALDRARSVEGSRLARVRGVTRRIALASRIGA